jgi:hypothetical protein
MLSIKQIFKLTLIAMVFSFAGCGDEDACEGKQCPDGLTLNTETCDCGAETTGVSEDGTLPTNITENMTLTSDNIYYILGKSYVASGVTLTIEPGTIIKGKEGTGPSASALIIARGAKIEACGTAARPIIFTSELDNIAVGETLGSNLDINDRELWGGLIVLGYAPISAKDGDTETQIEGIPADISQGKYGGDDAADNSGSLCYVSIRHGGALIGADNEINGLTLGGVGNGTSINNIEVVANLDDGIEFFGGTVNVTNALVAYQGDDAIDIDMNYSGTIDNAYIIHGGDDTDEAFEIDGPEGSTYIDGKFTINNATAVAEDTQKTSGADLKSFALGTLNNVSWSGYEIGRAVSVRASFDVNNDCAQKEDSYTNAIAGDLVVTNCELVSADAENSDIARVYIDSKSDDAPALQNCLDATDYQSVIDATVIAAGNKVESTRTKGADTSVFSWTLAQSKGLIK